VPAFDVDTFQRFIFLFASGSFSNRPRTPVDNSDNEDSLNDSELAELERKITASPAVFQLRKVVNSPYPGWRLYFSDNGNLAVRIFFHLFSYTYP